MNELRHRSKNLLTGHGVCLNTELEKKILQFKAVSKLSGAISARTLHLTEAQAVIQFSISSARLLTANEIVKDTQHNSTCGTGAQL